MSVLCFKPFLWYGQTISKSSWTCRCKHKSVKPLPHDCWTALHPLYMEFVCWFSLRRAKKDRRWLSWRWEQGCPPGCPVNLPKPTSDASQRDKTAAPPREIQPSTAESTSHTKWGCDGVSALFQSPVSSWPLFEISSIGYHLALLLFLKFSTANHPLPAAFAGCCPWDKSAPLPISLFTRGPWHPLLFLLLEPEGWV